MKKCLWVLMSAALLVSAGCSSMNVGIAPSTTPITERDTYTVTGPKVSAGAYGWMNNVFIPVCFGADSPSKTATERAIRQGGGNGLIEVSEKYGSVFLLIGSLYYTRVDGTPVKIERGGAN